MSTIFPPSPVGNSPLETPFTGTPTFAQVFSTVRQAHLGDISSDAGAIAQDSRLLAAGQNAYRVMYQSLTKVESPKLRRTAYWRIRPYTSYLSPLILAQLGLPPIGQPISVYERVDGCMIPITAINVNQSPTDDPNPYLDLTVDLTQATPAIQDGSAICVFGCNAYTADVNDEWSVTIPTTNTLRLPGCVAAPVPVGSSKGYIMSSPEPWPQVPMTREQDMQELDLMSPNSTLSRWTWTDDAFRFRPASQIRQLKFKYKISPEPPTDLNTPLGVQGSLPFLAAYTAALFANSIASGKSSAQALFTLATGHPAGEIGDAVGGYLGLLTGPAIKSNQMARIVVGRFRPKRSTSPVIRY